MPIFRLSKSPVFPAPSLSEPDGLLAIGGDLSLNRLLTAYRHGIFPWYDEHSPILWWSPDPRPVLFPEEFRTSRRLQRTIRSGHFKIHINKSFGAVIRACAMVERPGQKSTWITEEMIAAYQELHLAGFAHSVESWLNGRLVGGLYGVALGKVFFGESMFYLVSNASKVALASLIAILKKKQYLLLDCQQMTAHMAKFGARDISRKDFLAILDLACSGNLWGESWENLDELFK